MPCNSTKKYKKLTEKEVILQIIKEYPSILSRETPIYSFNEQNFNKKVRKRVEELINNGLEVE